MTFATVGDQDAGDLVRVLAEADSGLFRLARALCLAPHAGADFVRRARLEFVPNSAAGLEADLWFSPLVECADAHTVVLLPAAAQALRAELARDPGQWARVRALTEEMQVGAPELVRRFTRLAVAEALGVAGTFEEELAAFEAGIAGDAADPAVADDLSRWLVHFLPRLASGPAAGGLAQRLVHAASARLAVDVPRGVVGRRGPGPVAAARAAARGCVDLGVRFDQDGLTLSHPPAAGARVLEVPGGERVRVELAGAGANADGDAGYVVEVPYGESVRVPVTVFAEVDAGGAAVGSSDAGNATELGRVDVVFGAFEAMADGPVRAVLRRVRRGPGAAGTELSAWSRDRDVVAVDVPQDAGLVRVVGGPALVLLRSGGELLVHDAGEPPRSIPVRRSCIGRVVDAQVRVPRRIHELILLDAAGVTVGEVTASQVGGRVDGSPRWPETVRVWAGERSDVLVLADASGRLEFRDLAGAVCGPTFRTDIRPITAMTGAADGWPLVFAQTGPRLVRMESATSARLVWDTGSTADITSLAVTPDESATAAVDADGRLLLWRGPVTSEPREVALPFRAESVSMGGAGTFAVVGRGGPVELRGEDGRVYLLAPRRPDDDGDTGWLLDTVLGTMPVDAEWDPARLRASGVACVCLSVPMWVGGVDSVAVAGRWGDVDVADASAHAAHAVLAAERAGVRVLVDLDLSGWSGSDRREAPGLLRGVAMWLDRGAAGVRVLGRQTYVDGMDVSPIEFLGELRRLVDARQGRVLVLDRSLGPSLAEAEEPGPASQWASESESGSGLMGLFDLVLDEPPLDQSGFRVDSRSEASVFGGRIRTLEGNAWAVDPGEVVGPFAGAEAAALLSLLVALRGFRAISRWPEPELARRLAPLLRARADERALSRGTVVPLSFLYPEVLGTRHRYAGEVVVCLANLAGVPRTVALTAPTVPAGILVDLFDPGSARAEHGDRAALGDLGAVGRRPRMITLAAHEYRWFRVVTADELYASRS